MNEQIDDVTENEYPEWYLKNYEALEAFLNLDQEQRSLLVGEASGIFGTVLSALTPAGQAAVMSSGQAFLEANLESTGDRFANIPREHLLYLMLGVAIESIGIQQMKISLTKESAS